MRVSSTQPALTSTHSMPAPRTKPLPTTMVEATPVSFEREVAPTLDLAAIRAQLADVSRAHATELAQVEADVEARAAVDERRPFEANSELDAKLAQLLKNPVSGGLAPAPAPAIYVEYARMSQLPGASELLQELAPLIEQLQRLTWAREFAEVQVAREENLLQRDRRAFFAKRAQVTQLTAVTGRGAARRLAVRAAMLAAATRRLADPTESLKTMLDEFDVRLAPLNKLEPSAVELFRTPQAQLRRSIAELSFLALEIDSQASELLDATQHLTRLLHEVNV